MVTDNIFQNYGTNYQQPNNNFNYWNTQNNQLPNQPPYYNNGFMRQAPMSSNIPVRVVFSPEQINPQEIPTNGTPALFPLSNGSKIIARSLSSNGMFEERNYVLQQEDQNPQNNEFEQVMTRLGNIENSLNQVLNDLYGSKSQTAQEGVVNKNE